LGIGRDAWDEADWRAWGLSKWICGDVTLDTLAAFRVTPDVITHCAGSGSVGFSFQDPAEDFQSTAGTLLSTLEFIRLRAPEARLVYPSSAAVYGEVDHLPIREEAAPRPASPYGTHKLVAELLCQSYSRHFNLKVVIVRLFSLYGPWLRKQLLWDACCKFSRGEATFLGTGEESRDWLHVVDSANLLQTAAEHAGRDCTVVNGGSGVGTSVREVLTMLRQSFPDAPPLHFTAQAKAGDPKEYLGDCSKAEVWGWKPAVSLRAGLVEYSTWFQGERP
jgi:UDP-glucose 4-epimerase